ncbi:MAG TPA: nucleotidyltransferase family protein [Terracidiphilus sp.]|jgi:CTP:molybdopterin cytidylyltransferase MocA|nr:nucleotidyltransferase family protein [Terracidiphilus sp.]
MPVAAILLAAGASRRLGQPKQLLQVHGETLVARNVRIACEAGASQVFVVLGAESKVVQQVLDGTEAIAIENHRWQEGLSTSVRAGVEAVEAHSGIFDGVLLMNCDQPRLDSVHLASLIAVFEARSREVIVASSYAGTNGVPALFPRRLFNELKMLTGDKGARMLFARNTDALIAVPFDGGDIDIDTPDDLAHLA